MKQKRNKKVEKETYDNSISIFKMSKQKSKTEQRTKLNEQSDWRIKQQTKQMNVTPTKIPNKKTKKGKIEVK